MSLSTVSLGVKVANSLNNTMLTKVMAVALACIAPAVAFKPSESTKTAQLDQIVGVTIVSSLTVDGLQRPRVH